MSTQPGQLPTKTVNSALTGIVYSNTTRTVLVDGNLDFYGSLDNPLSVQFANLPAIVKSLSGDLNSSAATATQTLT